MSVKVNIGMLSGVHIVHFVGQAMTWPRTYAAG
jgi:hypothetical protein